MMRKFNIWASLFLSFFSILFFIFCAEVILRSVDPLNRKARKIYEDWKKESAAWDDGKTQFRVSLPRMPKRENEIRILALGDSFTWGDGIKDPQDVWPAQLEEKLRKEYGTGSISVVNLGIRGLTTVNEFELLVKVGSRFEPDLVIIQYLINDVLPSGPNLIRVGESWMQTRKVVNLISHKKLHDFTDRKIYFYAFMNAKFQALQRKIWPSRTWAELYKDDAKTWSAFKKALAGIGNWSRQKDIGAILVMFPNFGYGKVTLETFPHKNTYDKVHMFAESSGFEVIELLPYYIKGKELKDWKVHPSDGHPGEDAHELAARVISEVISGKKLLNVSSI